MDALTPGWRSASLDVEGADVDIAGVNPWHGRWQALDRGPITVAHPSYPEQRHLMNVYETTATGIVITFAAGEFSNGAWGFYVPA